MAHSVILRSQLAVDKTVKQLNLASRNLPYSCKPVRGGFELSVKSLDVAELEAAAVAVGQKVLG